MPSFTASVFKKNITVIIIVLMMIPATGYAAVQKKKTDTASFVKTSVKKSSRSESGKKTDRKDDRKNLKKEKKVPSKKNTVSRAANQKKITEKKHEIEAIDSKIKERQSEIQKFSEKESEIMGNLNNLDIRLNASRQKLNATKKKIVLLDAEMKTNYNDLNTVKAAIADNKTDISRRLVSMYKLNQVGRMNVMASADSVFDFLKRRKSMEFILKSDERLLNDYMKNQALLSELQTRLDEKKKTNESLAGDFKNDIAQVEQNRTQRKDLLGEIRQRKNLSLAAVQSLKDSAEELNRTVMALTREMEQARTLKAKPAPDKSSQPKVSYSYAPEKEDNSSPFLSRRGQLALPVKGRIVGFFGLSSKNEFNAAMFNTGIQVAADRGEPIQAVGPGQVIFADWLKGYGNMVIIDHGNGYYSLYCHAEEVFKKKGDPVEDREVIATVGDTGSLTGPGLHFEIRHKGEPVDPLKWLKKGKG